MNEFKFDYGGQTAPQSSVMNTSVAPSPVNTGGNTSQPGQIDWQKFFSNPIFANFFRQYQQQQQQMPGVSPQVNSGLSPQALSLLQLLSKSNFGKVM